VTHKSEKWLKQKQTDKKQQLLKAKTQENPKVETE
jgi:hypothetical protein